MIDKAILATVLTLLFLLPRSGFEGMLHLNQLPSKGLRYIRARMMNDPRFYSCLSA